MSKFIIERGTTVKDMLFLKGDGMVVSEKTVQRFLESPYFRENNERLIPIFEAASKMFAQGETGPVIMKNLADMNKVTRLPIGLGMNHIEQEIAACHLWNRNIRENVPPDSWVEIQEFNGSDMFSKNMQTGKSLENSGFIEVDREAGLFRLTQKAIDLLKKFTGS